MEPFRVHILGCGCALPSPRHYASSQIVELRGKLFMVDCGEATQIQLRRAKVRFGDINHIFISHRHGDHCLGLVGMLSTFGMLGRTAPMHVYADGAIEHWLRVSLDLFSHTLGYEVVFHALDTERPTTIYDDRSLTITTIPLDHRMPCCGFLFQEKPTLPHIRRDIVDMYGISISQLNNIKLGADGITPDGETIPNARLVSPPDPTRSYAYCSDTHYLPELHKQIAGVSTLYHEATYTSADKGKADKYKHSTAVEAAQVARDAGAGQLIIGHFSSRYNDGNQLLQEAKQVFPNTKLAWELMTVDV